MAGSDEGFYEQTLGDSLHSFIPMSMDAAAYARVQAQVAQLKQRFLHHVRLGLYFIEAYRFFELITDHQFIRKVAEQEYEASEFIGVFGYTFKCFQRVVEAAIQNEEWSENTWNDYLDLFDVALNTPDINMTRFYWYLINLINFLNYSVILFPVIDYSRLSVTTWVKVNYS